MSSMPGAQLEPEKQAAKPKMWGTVITAILFMVVIAVIFKYDLEKIKTLISQTGYWGIPISIIIYAALGLTVVPSDPITILIGAMYGPWMALLISGIGNTLAAMVEYFLGRRISSTTQFSSLKEKLPFGLAKLKVDSPYFLIFARMIPAYGSKVVSMMAGMYRVPLRRYLWTTVIPIFLGSAIYAFGGFGLKKLL
jgi:uncharacterized membrane protein YdjX (TVP38/TMEM64 family)